MKKLNMAVYASNHSFTEKKKAGKFPARPRALDFSSIEKDFEKPEDMFYEIQPKLQKLNIIPYEVKSKLNPSVSSPKVPAEQRLEVGDLNFVLTLYIHRRIGPNFGDYVCPNMNYGKPCPICELKNALYKEGRAEEAKQFVAKQRDFFNVLPLGSKTIQILEGSHFWYGQEFDNAAREEMDENGSGYVPFADLEDGKIIRFRGDETEFKIKVKDADGKEHSEAVLRPAGIKFEDRTDELDPNLYKKAYSFDQFINLLSYEELKAVLEGAETPDDEEEEEDEKKTNKDSTPKCPKGHEYGQDHDEFPECEECKLWSACAKAK